MFQNSFEGGYHDGIRGRQRVFNGDDYRSGYQKGVERSRSDQRVTLWTAAFLVLVVGVAITVLAADAVVARMPV